jgi:hypothetical protein
MHEKFLKVHEFVIPGLMQIDTEFFPHFTNVDVL